MSTSYRLPAMFGGLLPDGGRAFVVVIPDKSSHKITIGPRHPKDGSMVPEEGAVIISDGWSMRGADDKTDDGLVPGFVNSSLPYRYVALDEAILNILQPLVEREPR